MIPDSKKKEFIRLRAEGLSFRAIQDKLGVSKSTCQKWDQTCKDEVAAMKAESMRELYTAYNMTREARIKKLGDTLNRLQDALDSVDLSKLPAEKLLDYYLKYSESLRAEYTPPSMPVTFKDRKPAEILDAMTDLVNRIRAGEISSSQADKESAALTNLIKAYEVTELKDKVDYLESIVEGQGTLRAL